MTINLTPELARLVSYTATVARAIRMYSAYSPSGCRDENAPVDLMWLSDSLHNFDRLGNAIIAGNPSDILEACNMLLSHYQGYQEVHPSASRQAKSSFERNGARVDLNKARAIFSDIRTKVLPLTQPE